MPVLEITYLEIIVLEIRDPAQSMPVLEIIKTTGTRIQLIPPSAVNGRLWHWTSLKEETGKNEASTERRQTVVGRFCPMRTRHDRLLTSSEPRTVFLRLVSLAVLFLSKVLLLLDSTVVDIKSQ
jgi:hypothetical protein